MLYAIIGIFPLFQPILGYVNHKNSSAFVALGPPALWSHPFNKDENPPLGGKWYVRDGKVSIVCSSYSRYWDQVTFMFQSQELIQHRLPEWEKLAQVKDMTKETLKIMENLTDMSVSY